LSVLSVLLMYVYTKYRRVVSRGLFS